MAKVLSLAIDAAGMRIGAQEAERALQQVDAASKRAVDGIDQTQQKLDTAGRAASSSARSFGVVGEALSIGGRVRALGTELTQLGSGFDAVAQSGTIVAAGLLDVAQVIERVRQARLAETGAEAATGFRALINVLSGNPLLLAATAIGGIAAAMSLFTSKTKEATDAQKQLGDAIARAARQRIDVNFRAAIGAPVDPGELAQGQVSRLGEAFASLKKSGDSISPSELAKLLEVSQDDLRRRLGGSDPFKRNPNVDVTSVRQGAGLFETQFDYTNEAALKAIQDRARYFQQFPAAAVGSSYGTDLPVAKPTPAAQAAEQVPDASRLREYLDALREETRLAGLSRDEREKAVAVYQAEQLARQEGIALTGAESNAIRENIDLQRQLSDLRDIGQQAGEVVGNGLFRIAQNARNAREALVGVLQQLAAIAQQRVVAGFGNAVANAFAGTASQARADVALPSGASPVGPYADGYRFS